MALNRVAEERMKFVVDSKGPPEGPDPITLLPKIKLVWKPALASVVNRYMSNWRLRALLELTRLEMLPRSKVVLEVAVSARAKVL